MRDKETKLAHLLAPSCGGWKLYRVNTNMRGSAFPLLEGKKGGLFTLPAIGMKHTLFIFEQNGRRQLLAERQLPMQGGYNCRDMGGLAAPNGKHTRWGLVIRSDSLSSLTTGDLEYLASIPVATVVDFRSGNEAGKKPDRLPKGARAVHLPVLPGRFDSTLTREEQIASIGAVKLMEHMVRLLVEVPEIIAGYREFFRLLQDEANLPLLFHCSAGKDRTGHAAALFLFSLGVDTDTVLRDYLASAKYLQEKFAVQMAARPSWAPLFTVKEEYLRVAIQTIEAKSGSVEAYLEEELGVDRAKMRSLYLQDAGQTLP